MRHTACGGEPLRDLLRRARRGEEILLASYCPFSRPGPFREFGPIYVSTGNESPEPAWIFTPRADPSLDYFKQQLTLRAYAEDGAICDAVIIAVEAAPRQLENLFQRPNVEFVDARFPSYGCFAARFHRPEFHSARRGGAFKQRPPLQFPSAARDETWRRAPCCSP